MKKTHRILAINVGSTSTKVAIFEDGKQTAAETLRHATELISQFPAVYDQLEFRTAAVTAVGRWPKISGPYPQHQSRYSLPSTSQNRDPSP